MLHFGAKQTKTTTLSNNNIKCGKLFVGYFKINCITNYTTTGKYCKLINCSAWWRWMSPTAPVVPFSNSLATVIFKKRTSLKKSRVGFNWFVLCRRIKRESILIPFKTHWLWDDGTGSAKMLTRFRVFAYKVTS